LVRERVAQLVADQREKAAAIERQPAAGDLDRDGIFGGDEPRVVVPAGLAEIQLHALGDAQPLACFVDAGVGVGGHCPGHQQRPGAQLAVGLLAPARSPVKRLGRIARQPCAGAALGVQADALDEVRSGRGHAERVASVGSARTRSSEPGRGYRYNDPYRSRRYRTR
jgi:hypothetical protein